MITQQPGKLVRRKPSQPAPAAPTVLVRRRRQETKKMAQPVRERVAKINRQPGWPEMADDVEDTDYVVVNGHVVAFVTDCKGLSVGWDLCGRCALHVTRCRCNYGVAAPRSIVYIWRTTNGIEYTPETAGGGPYIGMRHDPVTREAKPMEFIAPVRRQPAPVVKEEAPAKPTFVRRTKITPPANNVQKKAEQVSTKLVRRTPTRKG